MAALAMNLDHLGTPLGPMTRVQGKSSNRVYRLDTDEGSFAVKELDLDRGWTLRHGDVFRFERAAFAAGVPMPEPISAGADVLVHRWVEGEVLPEAPVSHAFAFELGEILARVHALDVAWTPTAGDGPAPRSWPLLADRAVSTRQPWAAELVGTVDAFLAIADFVDSCERSGPVVLTHRDIQPWNLLARDGRPVVLDWEISGALELAGELGSTALGISKGPGFEDVDPTVFRAVLDGYVAGGGELPPAGPDWFRYMIGGWLGFTHQNVVRCLAGAPADPELVACHDEVRNGLHGLPDMFRRLPELEDLLPTGR
jgi:aminoglycoside phosphotransferase (APT) family kinase protein